MYVDKMSLEEMSVNKIQGDWSRIHRTSFSSQLTNKLEFNITLSWKGLPVTKTLYLSLLVSCEENEML
jgi:hypothetical protein